MDVINGKIIRIFTVNKNRRRVEKVKKTRPEEQNPVGWVEKGMEHERRKGHNACKTSGNSSGLVWFGIKGHFGN